MPIRRGGSAKVELKGEVARKTLRISSPEKRRRFAREIGVLRSIQQKKQVLNVVEIVRFNMDDEPPWYEMRRYPGDSNHLLPYTRRRVPETALLFIPIVRTLKMLAELDPPIYHRDLKPANLLYDGSPGSPTLVLADFGCAYFQTDDDERLTQEFRAVGAMAYRAPEYHYGRVDQVDEKGDVFSIGKVLWFFVNAVKGEVFPYTLWFPPEYDLVSRFPNIEGVNKLNLIIASAVHHDPQQRIGYDELLPGLEDLVRTPSDTTREDEQIGVLRYDAELKLRLEESRSITRDLLQVFWDDVRFAISRLREQFPESPAVRQMDSSFARSRSMPVVQNTLRHIIDEDSNCPLWNHHEPNLRISSRVHSAREWSRFHSAADVHPDCPFVALRCDAWNREGKKRQSEIYWYYQHSSGPGQVLDGQIVPHKKMHAYQLLHSSFMFCVS